MKTEIKNYGPEDVSIVTKCGEFRRTVFRIGDLCYIGCFEGTKEETICAIKNKYRGNETAIAEYIENIETLFKTSLLDLGDSLIEYLSLHYSNAITKLIQYPRVLKYLVEDRGFEFRYFDKTLRDLIRYNYRTSPETVSSYLDYSKKSAIELADLLTYTCIHRRESDNYWVFLNHDKTSHLMTTSSFLEPILMCNMEEAFKHILESNKDDIETLRRIKQTTLEMESPMYKMVKKYLE